ncbi:metallophosphoesterase [Teredinibacter waterburyi]|uniref:metallophosphoesterase n=1 Tax=Teredinibacter waterburyi TaxID=1500538 RepID=UPI00165F4638|nr:metallophosphoesterase [Teredinibacter waterburyi]
MSINSNGVDYICSDIHGHFSLLKALLDKVNFDPSKDRLFSLGDLIDRGPECEEVLKWLRYEWFYAIQGNHERMLINAVEQKSSHVFMQWHAWGGSWAEDFDLVELQEYYQVLSNLPVAIELQVSGSKKVALVHAELPDQCDWLDVIDQLASVDKKDVEKNRLVSDMFWK